MKKLCVFLVSLILVFSLSVTVFAGKIKIDGKVTNEEWLSVSKGAGSDGSKPGTGKLISYLVQYEFDKNGYDLKCRFFACYENSAEEAEKSNCGIVLKLGDGEYTNTVSLAQPCDGDTGDYSVRSYVSAETVDFSTYEINSEACITCKDRFDKGSFSFSVQFIDELGNTSNRYTVRAVNADNTSSATEKSTTEKTTKEKTTKEKTTKEKTTQATTVKERKTAKPVSTTRHKVTVRQRTTAVKTTQAATEKAKTKKSSAKVKTTLKTTAKKEKYVYSQSTVYEPAVTETTAVQETQIQTEESGISKSTKYKIVACAAAVILFGVIGVWAVKSRDDTVSDDETKDSKEN